MKKIAQFHKVSFGQFLESWQDTFEGTSEDEVRQIFDSIELPKRATRGSAGYDFYSPVDFELKPGETIKIPTGIRVYMEDSVFSVWSLSRKSIALEMLIFSFSQNSNNSFPFLKSVFMIWILLLYMKRIRKMSYR